MLTLKNVIFNRSSLLFSTEARLLILKLSLDWWRWNESGSDLKFWFRILVGLTRKTRQTLIEIFSQFCLKKYDFFVNDTKHRQIIYQIEACEEISHFILILSSKKDQWQSCFYLNSRSKWVSHSCQKSNESPTIEVGIGTKVDLGSCWGCQWIRRSFTANQPRGGSHHGFLKKKIRNRCKSSKTKFNIEYVLSWNQNSMWIALNFVIIH